jgi:CheY-like chemotaxis protein
MTLAWVVLGEPGRGRVSPPEPTMAGACMSPRILVASADVALADLVAAVLADDGYTVLRADRGTPTLTAVRDGGYELLVTDDLAARVDDVLLLRYLRDFPGLALPIVLLALVRPLPLPPNTTFLAIPFDIAALSALVADLLAKARDGYWG